MAKPGSRAARSIAGARDLSRAKLTDAEVLEAMEMIELQQGRRCAGCGRRITVGFHFTSIAPREEHPVLRMSACTRDDCDFAQKAREGATVVEAVEYAWLDELGPAAPASKLAEGERFVMSQAA